MTFKLEIFDKQSVLVDFGFRRVLQNDVAIFIRYAVVVLDDKSKSFDLNGETALATEPSGLGNTFSLNYKESEKGKHLTNVTPEFEPIKLSIYVVHAFDFRRVNPQFYVRYTVNMYAQPTERGIYAVNQSVNNSDNEIYNDF